MPLTHSASTRIVRAATDTPWSKDCPPSILGLCDFSDHHPVEGMIGDITFISYNMQFLPTLFSGASGKKHQDLNEITRLIVEWLTRDGVQYDVICLQEMYDATAARLMEKKLACFGYTASFLLGGGIVGDAMSGGVRIFARQELRMEDKGGHIFTHYVDLFEGMDGLVSKGVKHVVVKKLGHTYHVMNVHTQAFYEDPSRENFVEVALAQLMQLKKYIERQKDSKVIAPTDCVILCGDFNIPKQASYHPPEAGDQRGDALFKRAQLLLGSDVIVIEPKQIQASDLSHSFSPATNSYLRHTKEQVTANFDLVFVVDSDPIVNNMPFLDVFVRSMQRQLSLLVQKKTRVLSSRMSKEDIQVIHEGSTALDAFIDFCQNKQILPSSLMLASLFNVIKKNLTQEQNQIQLDFLCAIMERSAVGREVCLRIQQAIEYYISQSEKQRSIAVMKRWLESQIVLFLYSADLKTDADTLAQWMRRLGKKATIDLKFQKLSDLIYRWERNGQKKMPVLETLYGNLQKALDRYFSIFGKDEKQFRAACEKEIYECLGLLIKSSGTVMETLAPRPYERLFIAHFLTSFGKEFGFPSWVMQGGALYATQDRAMLHLNQDSSGSHLQIGAHL